MFGVQKSAHHDDGLTLLHTNTNVARLLSYVSRRGPDVLVGLDGNQLSTQK